MTAVLTSEGRADVPDGERAASTELTEGHLQREHRDAQEDETQDVGNEERACNLVQGLKITDGSAGCMTRRMYCLRTYQMHGEFKNK